MNTTRTRTLVEHLNIRLAPTEGDALKRLADELGLSLSELLRLLISKGLAQLLGEVGADDDGQ